MNDSLPTDVVDPAPNASAEDDWTNLAKKAAEEFRRTAGNRRGRFERTLELTRLLAPVLVLLIAVALVFVVYRKNADRLVELEQLHQRSIDAIKSKSDELVAGDKALAQKNTEFVDRVSEVTTKLDEFRAEKDSPLARMITLSGQLDPNNGLGKNLTNATAKIESLGKPDEPVAKLLETALNVQKLIENNRLVSRIDRGLELLERNAFGNLQFARSDVRVIFPHNGRLGMPDRDVSLSIHRELTKRVPFVAAMAAQDRVGTYDAEMGKTNDDFTYNPKSWQLPNVESIPVILIVPPHAESPPGLLNAATPGTVQPGSAAPGTGRPGAAAPGAAPPVAFPSSTAHPGALPPAAGSSRSAPPGAPAGWWTGRKVPIDVVFLQDGSNVGNEVAWRNWSSGQEPRGFFVVVSGNWNKDSPAADQQRLVEAISMLIWNRAMSPADRPNAGP